MSANDDKRIQLIGSTETYAYGTWKDLVCTTAEIKCKNINKKNDNLWLYYKKKT